MSSPGKIFNVKDLTAIPAPGAEHSPLDSTVAEATIDAPSPQAARQIERNASKEREAAQQAAAVAKTLGSDYTGEPNTAAGEFYDTAERRTNAAVAEGKHDVAEAKATAAGYVEQAKAYATAAFETAQSYLPGSAVGGKTSTTTIDSSAHPQTTGNTSTGLLTSAEITAENVHNKVSTAAQPHIEHVREVAQPHIEHANSVAQGYMGTVGMQGSALKPAGEHNAPAASTAPLESGPHTVKAPYPYPPASNDVKIGDIAASGGQPSIHN